MFKVATVFGIRPDFIRSSVLLKRLIKNPLVDLQFIYTGQHYDEKLKGVFFRELELPEPQFILDAIGKNHVEQHAKLIGQLGEALEMIKPDVCLFLGDANAVIGCIAPLKMGIPIAHVEAGMRSFDWSMPEERNRVIIDRVSDVLYAYQHDYKTRLVQEGINPNKIVVTGNTICDVIDDNIAKIREIESDVLKKYNVTGRKFYGPKYGVMTLHRNDVMSNPKLAFHILDSVGRWARERECKIILPMMPRLKALNWEDKSGMFHIVEPLGMLEWMALERNASIEFTDSGTNQETSAIFGTPCVVTRLNTERPETFESGITKMGMDDIGLLADAVLGRTQKMGFTLNVENKSPAKIIEQDLVNRLTLGFPSLEVHNPFVLRHTHLADYNLMKYTGSWA